MGHAHPGVHTLQKRDLLKILNSPIKSPTLTYLASAKESMRKDGVMQSLTRILESQCPSVFTIEGRCKEDF